MNLEAKEIQKMFLVVLLRISASGCQDLDFPGHGYMQLADNGWVCFLSTVTSTYLTVLGLVYYLLLAALCW